MRRVEQELREVLKAKVEDIEDARVELRDVADPRARLPVLQPGPLSGNRILVSGRGHLVTGRIRRRKRMLVVYHLVPTSDEPADMFDVIAIDRVPVHDDGAPAQWSELRVRDPVSSGLRNHLHPVDRLTIGCCRDRLPHVLLRRLQADVENAELGVWIADSRSRDI